MQERFFLSKTHVHFHLHSFSLSFLFYSKKLVLKSCVIDRKKRPRRDLEKTTTRIADRAALRQRKTILKSLARCYKKKYRNITRELSIKSQFNQNPIDARAVMNKELGTFETLGKLRSHIRKRETENRRQRVQNIQTKLGNNRKIFVFLL